MANDTLDAHIIKSFPEVVGNERKMRTGAQ